MLAAEGEDRLILGITAYPTSQDLAQIGNTAQSTSNSSKHHSYLGHHETQYTVLTRLLKDFRVRSTGSVRIVFSKA